MAFVLMDGWAARVAIMVLGIKVKVESKQASVAFALYPMSSCWLPHTAKVVKS